MAAARSAASRSMYSTAAGSPCKNRGAADMSAACAGISAAGLPRLCDFHCLERLLCLRALDGCAALRSMCCMAAASLGRLVMSKIAIWALSGVLAGDSLVYDLYAWHSLSSAGQNTVRTCLQLFQAGWHLFQARVCLLGL